MSGWPTVEELGYDNEKGFERQGGEVDEQVVSPESSTSGKEEPDSKNGEQED